MSNMVTLDDEIDADDPTLPYRTQIMAAVTRIDDALRTTAVRELMSTDEFQDVLLDLRSLLA